MILKLDFSVARLDEGRDSDNEIGEESNFANAADYWTMEVDNGGTYLTQNSDRDDELHTQNNIQIGGE